MLNPLSQIVVGFVRYYPVDYKFYSLTITNKKRLEKNKDFFQTFMKSGRRDLNPQPPAPKAGAIANYATPRLTTYKLFIISLAFCRAIALWLIEFFMSVLNSAKVLSYSGT